MKFNVDTLVSVQECDATGADNYSKDDYKKIKLKNVNDQQQQEYKHFS